MKPLTAKQRKERRDGWGIFRYRPTFPTPDRPKVNDQLAVHRSQATIRVIIGANGVGKTHCAVAEPAALILGGDYPDWWGWDPRLTPPPPLKIWLMSPQFAPRPKDDARIEKLFIGTWTTDPERGERVYQPPMIPQSFLKNPGLLEKDGQRVLETKNDCTLIIKSALQAVSAHAGDAPDLIIIDESIDGPVWGELVGRLIRKPACRIIHCLTDAAENNLTDYLDFLKGKEGCEFFRFAGPNPNVAEDHRQKVISFLSPEQQRIRGAGETVAEVRRCYPFANHWHQDDDLTKPEVLNPWGGHGNWIPKDRQFPIPFAWTKYVVHDPGVTNPGAAAWIAVEPGLENLYVYKGLYWRQPHVDFMETVKDIFTACGAERIRAFFIDPKDAKKPVQFVGRTPRERLKIDSYNRAASRVLGRRFRFAMAPSAIECMERAVRIAHLTAYLSPRHNSMPMIWFFDGDAEWQEALHFEFDKYHWAAAPKGRTRNPDKPVPKHNDMIYCVEVPCAMGFRWRPDEGEDHCVVPMPYDQYDPGGKIREFMDGGYAKDFNQTEFL